MIIIEAGTRPFTAVGTEFETNCWWILFMPLAEVHNCSVAVKCVFVSGNHAPREFFSIPVGNTRKYDCHCHAKSRELVSFLSPNSAVYSSVRNTTVNWSLVFFSELVMGHFSRTKPNPTQNFWTQPNPQKSSPDPTQPIIDTWYGILGYTENFIQQLLHVTDKFTDSTFYKPTVNESYYSAAVLINTS